MTRFWKYYFILLKLGRYKPRFFFFPLLYLIYKVFTITTLFFDKVFYPEFRIKKIDRPVFLLGHPRSGTTFLHRFILKNSPDFRGNLLWEMIFPAITARKIISPLIPKIDRKFRQNNIYQQHIHDTGLTEAETDDAAVFFRYFGGLLPWLYFNVWNCDREKLIPDLKKSVPSARFSNHLGNLYRKNSMLSGKRIFSKSFFSILEIENILKRYPDAKIIILLRNPEECVPSSMSLLKNMLGGLVDYEKIPEHAKKDFYSKIFSVSEFYFSEIKQIIPKYATNKQVLFIKYQALITDFEAQMTRIFEFMEAPVTDTLKNAITQQSEKQKNYKGTHKYSLQDFGIPENAFENKTFRID